MAAAKGDDEARNELSEGGRAKLQSLAAALRVTPDVLPAAPGGAILADLVHRMDRHDNDREAPVREVMSRLGDRWSTLILLVLSAGTFRHATLRRLIATMSAERAISQRMLTLRLRALERDGMVARTVTPTVPPRVDYALTPLGRDFVALIDSVLKWIERNDVVIQQSRERFEAEGR